MQWFALGLAVLLALAIIVIGFLYISSPLTTTRSFGLPLPGSDAAVAPWLRLKGVRDIVAGLAVLAMMVWGGPRMVGIILLVEALIPIGDMSVILAARGSSKAAFGMHAPTALLMILAGAALVMGAGPR